MVNVRAWKDLLMMCQQKHEEVNGKRVIVIATRVLAR
jgi:hypothetical protein